MIRITLTLGLRLKRIPPFAAAFAFALLCLLGVSAAAEGLSPFLDGSWTGKVELRDLAAADSTAPETESFALRLFPADPEAGSPPGGLVDMPSRGLFGFPLNDVLRDSEGISFALRGKAPFDGRFELKLSRASEAGADGLEGARDGGDSLSGTITLLSTEGSSKGGEALAEGGFSLSRESEAARSLAYGFDYPIDTGRGLLPGSLLLPEGDSGRAPPLVLILSGAQADRDGNNYSVPGKSDSLLQLALSLRGRGVATLRFDKRGTGEAYALVGDESELLFDDHIKDAMAALRVLAADLRFSSVTVVGFAEGALVGACALEGLPGGAFGPAAADSGATGAAWATGEARGGSRVPVAGLVALCASGRTELEIVEDALAATPAELKGEAEAIMSALKSGKRYPEPSPYFADYFRPSAQGYLASLFARDIRSAFAAAASRCPALVVAGGADLQVRSGEAELLAASAAGAAYLLVPGMSHALKGVGSDEESNYASFTDPRLPLAEGLVDLVAAFAKGEGAKGGEEFDEGPAR